MSERGQLLEHGTKAFELKPSSLIAAAEEDLRRAKRNASPGKTEYEHFAFHRRHVAKAVKTGAPKRIIELALADIDLGKSSGKHWTRVIYSNPDVLALALALALA